MTFSDLVDLFSKESLREIGIVGAIGVAITVISTRKKPDDGQSALEMIEEIKAVAIDLEKGQDRMERDIEEIKEKQVEQRDSDRRAQEHRQRLSERMAGVEAEVKGLSQRVRDRENHDRTHPPTRLPFGGR